MFQKYIHSHKAKIKLKQSSISTYCRKFEGYILPFFRQQEEISEKTVAEFTAHLQTSLADKTTADVLGLLSEILSCSGIPLEIYKPAVYPPEIVTFPKTEWERLRDYCVSHLDYLTYGILVAMYTGIRPGELSGARCRHIDFHSAVFKVRFTMQRIKNLDHTEQKTKIIIDMLINLTEWTEPHYQLNTERYLQRLVILMKQADIQLSFKTILEYIKTEHFQMLSSTLAKNEVITKQEHLLNVEICKVAGTIAESAAARFSTIAESEAGQIFDNDGIDIYTAIREHAVILFVLNPLLYPELSPLMGRMVLVDAKQAVSKCFNTNLERAFFVLDEISSYASSPLIDLVNKSRSANITCVLATQSLSDLDYSVDTSFREQVIENTNNYIVLRQNSATNAEAWADILGTRQSMEVTYQIAQQSRTTSTTGLGSARRIREFLYHPDEIKDLRTGEAFFRSHDEHFHCKLQINKPF